MNTSGRLQSKPEGFTSFARDPKYHDSIVLKIEFIS